MKAVRGMINRHVLEVHVCANTTPPTVVMYKNPGDVSFVNAFFNIGNELLFRYQNLIALVKITVGVIGMHQRRAGDQRHGKANQ